MIPGKKSAIRITMMLKIAWLTAEVPKPDLNPIEQAFAKIKHPCKSIALSSFSGATNGRPCGA